MICWIWWICCCNISEAWPTYLLLTIAVCSPLLSVADHGLPPFRIWLWLWRFCLRVFGLCFGFDWFCEDLVQVFGLRVFAIVCSVKFSTVFSAYLWFLVHLRLTIIVENKTWSFTILVAVYSWVVVAIWVQCSAEDCVLRLGWISSMIWWCVLGSVPSFKFGAIACVCG